MQVGEERLPRRAPSRSYSEGTGSFTLHTRSDSAQTSSASAMIRAPVRTNSLVGHGGAHAGTRFHIDRVAGRGQLPYTGRVMATRYSSSLTSLGIPMITAHSSMLLMTCLIRV